MDSAVTELLGVYECNYFRDTDFPRYSRESREQSSQISVSIMLQFFSEWTEDERVRTKMSSLSMDNVPNYVSSYFTKWNPYIIEYVSTIGNQICPSE